MMKKIKWLIIIIVLIALIVGGVFIYQEFFKTTSKTAVSEAEAVDSIEGYSYTLYDNAMEVYKELYYELKDILESDELDEESYAKTISEMFIVDFYTLTNKVTNQDVGGLEFVYSSLADNLKEKATDTIYKTVESNVYGDREQDLPEVSSVEVLSIDNETYTYTVEDDDYDISINDSNSYVVNLSWEYVEDLGYQSSATIRIVHENNILSIVSVE